MRKFIRYLSLHDSPNFASCVASSELDEKQIFYEFQKITMLNMLQRVFSGIYIFAVNIVNGEHWMLAHIMKGSDNLLSVICDSKNGDISTGSATVIITCQSGEIVYIRTGDSAPLGIWGDTNDRLSSFAGFLLSVA